MIANIDENVGKLLAKLQEWGIENDTLVIFMNDNGGFDLSCRIFNDGMRGSKNTPHNGGTRAISLWRWPGALKPATCERLAAHIDMFPTFAELTGAKVPPEVLSKLEGFSLVPLLADPNAAGHDDRVLFTHIGRWPMGSEPAKLNGCSVRWKNYLAVNEGKGWTLYDLHADHGETKDLAKSDPQVMQRLERDYDAWWKDTIPLLENEQAYKTAPKVNPFKELYWKQYDGPGPNNVAPGTYIKPG